MNIVILTNTATSAATAVGVIVAAISLWQAKNQSISTFEDAISNEYRQISKSIPIAALLGGEFTPEEVNRSLREIYNYIDFTNEQIYLRQMNRIRQTTWKSWVDGIRTNMERTAIKQAWDHIKEKCPDSFHELRKLEEQSYSGDPILWK